MKILSGPQGHAFLTNVEVKEWLKEKNFELPRKQVPFGEVRTPLVTASIAKDVRRYIQSSPSSACTVDSVRTLFERLQKFNLSAPELLMIANIRPEAYAHLTPLIANIYSRFDEDTIYEILEIINSSLEKRVNQTGDATDGLQQSDADDTAQESHISKAMLDVNLDHSGLPSHQNKGTCATLMDISLTGATPSNHAEQYGGAKRTDTSVMDISKEKEFSSSMGADATVTDISMTRTGQQGPHGMKRSSMTLANDATVTDISGRGQIGTMKPPRVSTEGTDATVTDISGAPHARNTTSSAETNKGIGKGA